MALDIMEKVNIQDHALNQLKVEPRIRPIILRMMEMKFVVRYSTSSDAFFDSVYTKHPDDYERRYGESIAQILRDCVDFYFMFNECLHEFADVVKEMSEQKTAEEQLSDGRTIQ